MKSLRLYSKNIFDRKSGRFREGWMEISSKKIKRLEWGEPGAKDRRQKITDYHRLHLGPSGIDLHVHSRGFEESHKETFETLEAGAFRGGVGAVACMANTRPRLDSVDCVKEFIRLAKKQKLSMIPFAAVTENLEGKKDTNWEALLRLPIAGLSDDGKPLLDDDRMRRATRVCKKYKKLISLHEEDLNLSCGSKLHPSEASILNGIEESPEESEVRMVKRDLKIAKDLKASVHFCHLSSKETVKALRVARRQKIRFSAELTPHHGLLTVDDAKGFCPDQLPYFKVCPVIRTKEDQAALHQALREGLIDCFASDHAPHSALEKDLPYDLAMHGILALENFFVLYNEIRHRAKLPWSRFFSCFSERPAELLGQNKRWGRLELGFEANFIVFDPDRRLPVKWVASLSKNEPYGDFKARGQIIEHWLRGERVYGEKVYG